MEVMACQEWNVLPSEMGLCEPEDDLTLMAAFISAKSDMQVWERHEEERKAALKSSAPAPRSSSSRHSGLSRARV